MNLNQLQYFKILAQEEHYTRAAQMLSITQPSLSHAIAQLEEELGTRLFEKKGRNIVLTRYGKLFLPYVEESLKVLEEGVQRTRELNGSKEGIIHLAYIYTMGSNFTPKMVRNFLDAYPDYHIDFHFTVGTTGDILAGLKEDADQKAAGKKEGLIDSLKHTHFSIESVAMILIGFTCTGTFQLWLNCAQNFAKENVGWADPSIMQTYYSAGTMLALIVTALLTRKIKDVRFIVVYPVICLVTLIVVLTGKSEALMIAGAFIIGWAGAGGLLQIATSVCNMLFPKIKGTVTALVMIASSLCNYTILTAASKMQPAQVMVMNIVLTAIGVLLGLFVNIRYAKMVEQAEAEN